MAKKITIAARIRKYVLENPTISAKQAAGDLRVPSARVHVVMSQLRKVGLIAPSTNPRGRKPKAVAPVVATPASVLFDPVNSPAHYKSGGIETIDYIEAKLTEEEFRGYLKGNMIKYGSRVGLKDDPIVDAGKLSWYAERYAMTFRKQA